MTKHILSLRYDGLDAATHHGIGTAGSKQVIGGAQILLGAHAHYYSGGKVPDRVDDRGEGFKISRRRTPPGLSHLRHRAADHGAGDLGRRRHALRIRAVPGGIYTAHRAGKLFKEPPHRRREVGPGNNSPLPDLDYAREHERRRLLQRMQQAVSFISAPLGITASVLEVSIDGKRIDTIRARQPGSNDIHEWLQAFRQGKVGSSRFQ